LASVLAPGIAAMATYKHAPASEAAVRLQPKPDPQPDRREAPDRSPAYEVRSAGTDPDARICVTAEHIGWADRIFVMEKHHQNRLHQRFGNELKGKSVVCLNIPDEYEPLEADLLEILRARLAPYLQLSEIGGA
jgi:predicted protein tyrosine phosphatase